MNKVQNIGLYETICLATLIIIYKLFYTGVAAVCNIVGTAAWYIPLLSAAVSIFFFYLGCILLSRFPGLNLFQIIEVIFGKYLGKLLNLIFVLYAVIYTSTALREFVEMIKVYSLPRTPISIVLGSFLIITAIVSYYGIEGIARICTACFIPIILGLVVILALAAPIYDINYLKPFGGYGLKNTLTTAFLRSSSFIEVAVLWLWVNSMHGVKNIQKAGIISLIISGAVYSITFFCYLMAFTYSVGSDSLSGLFELSRSIYYNRFFQRMESVFLFVWVISSLILVSTAFHVAVTIYAQTFKINNHRPLIFPFILLSFTVAILPKNVSELIYYLVEPLRRYSTFLLFVLTAFILLISIIMGKKGAVSSAKKT